MATELSVFLQVLGDLRGGYQLRPFRGHAYCLPIIKNLCFFHQKNSTHILNKCFRHLDSVASKHFPRGLRSTVNLYWARLLPLKQTILKTQWNLLWRTSHKTDTSLRRTVSRSTAEIRSFYYRKIFIKRTHIRRTPLKTDSIFILQMKIPKKARNERVWSFMEWTRTLI